MTRLDTSRPLPSNRSFVGRCPRAFSGVNLRGSATDVEGVSRLAKQRGIPLYIDSSHGFACEIAGKPIGGFGRLEVISFPAAHILGAAEGAVMCTDDDDLAAHVRNIRSNYGSGRPVPVGKTSNGRLSEAQAAIALMNLDDMPELMARNKRLFDTYGAHLSDIPGLSVDHSVRRKRKQRITKPSSAVSTCKQFGLTRDALIATLSAENVEARGDRGLGGAPGEAPAFGRSVLILSTGVNRSWSCRSVPEWTKAPWNASPRAFVSRSARRRILRPSLEREVKLGIMQPYFFPYLGHFALIAHTDAWVVFDITQYTPKTWMNRNRVLHPKGQLELRQCAARELEHFDQDERGAACSTSTAHGAVFLASSPTTVARPTTEQ